MKRHQYFRSSRWEYLNDIPWLELGLYFVACVGLGAWLSYLLR